MDSLSLVQANLLSPFVLAFILGIFAKIIKSELSLPKDLYASLSIYLLLALGLKGGVELAHASLDEILRPTLATLLLGVITPLTAFGISRYFGRFSPIDSAALSAHYGSVSAVTFIAAVQFVAAMGKPSEGFMPTLLTILESPGIHIGLALGAFYRSKEKESSASVRSLLHEVLTARSMILLIGGLIIGFCVGEKNYEPVKPFFEGGFKGALVLFLLELGLVAGSRLKDLTQVGPRILILGVLIPILHGMLGVFFGHHAGLSLGGATVLGAMAASASYIAAPPAVRITLPEANPAVYLTASLVVTFPFNLVVGIPLYFEFASWLVK